MKRLLTLVIGLWLGLLATMTLAHPIMVNSDNLAINGYDTVAYHQLDEAVEGVARFETQWQGATWRFISQQHLELFLAEPERYIPHYGSHCANAMSNGDKVDANPEIYRVIDGELYLYAARWGQLQWRFGVEGKIKDANGHWQAFKQRLGYANYHY